MGHQMTIPGNDLRVCRHHNRFERSGHKSTNGRGTPLNGRCAGFRRCVHTFGRSGHASERSVHQVISLNLSLKAPVKAGIRPPISP